MAKTHSLTAAQARKLADIDGQVAAAHAVLAPLEEEQKALRERYRPRIPAREAITVGGVTIKVTPTSTGERFSLSDYRAAGHKVTRAMAGHITEGEYDRWTIKREGG